ncbi:hypothetical protein QR685DRAFT_542550 [Neurospora intermedia]|uniref:Uncharacterized protein n=1 Tax=Neurospora intermedia TaxID=5142 RepID=A0ABR3DN35_NEUIN
MSGYQRRTNRGMHPEWWPHIHDLPINTATWNEFVNLPPLQLGEDVPIVYKKGLSSRRPGVKVRLALINFCHSEVSVRRMADVEDICVAEADRLGLNYVGIRQGPHNSESVYTDGCPTMIRDPKTGRMKKMQRQADWHITVVFGHSINELLLHGHI